MQLYREDIDPLTFTAWWDGRYGGQEAQQGVYVYVILLRGESAEVVTGTVAFLK